MEMVQLLFQIGRGMIIKKLFILGLVLFSAKLAMAQHSSEGQRIISSWCADKLHHPDINLKHTESFSVSDCNSFGQTFCEKLITPGCPNENDGWTSINIISNSWIHEVHSACQADKEEDAIKCFSAVGSTCYTSANFKASDLSACIKSTAEAALKNDSGPHNQDELKNVCALFADGYPVESCVKEADIRCSSYEDQIKYTLCAMIIVKNPGHTCTDPDYAFSRDDITACMNESIKTCPLQSDLSSFDPTVICSRKIADEIKKKGSDKSKYDTTSVDTKCAERKEYLDPATCTKYTIDACEKLSTDQSQFDFCVKTFSDETYDGCSSLVAGEDLSLCLAKALLECPANSGDIKGCAYSLGKYIKQAAENPAFASSCTPAYCIYAECWSGNEKDSRPTAVGDVCACKDQGGVKRYFKGPLVSADQVASSGGCSEGKSDTVINKSACGASPTGAYTAECMNGIRIQNIQIGYGPSACACSSSTLKRYITSDEKVITSITYTHSYICNDGFRASSTLETRDVISKTCDAHSGMKTARITDSSGNLVTNITYSPSSSSSSSSTSTTGTTSGGSTSGGSGKVDGTTSGGSTSGGSGKVDGTTSGGSTSGGSGKVDGTTSGGSTSGGTIK
jgi:hypothetical protein